MSGRHVSSPPTGQLDQAATWLLENAEADIVSGRGRASQSDPDAASHSAPLSGVEVKAESVCICFIDDCLDCDIPLAELTFSREWRPRSVYCQKSLHVVHINRLLFC